MIRRRGHGHEDEDSSSSDEEDAFSALSKKGNAKKKAKKNEPISSGIKPNSNDRKVVNEENSGSKSTEDEGKANSSSAPFRGPISVTSSMKRHHKPSDVRKAKMDALLQELEAEKDQIPKKRRTFVPEKKGSFVAPGEEHLTTNLFVGNLAPSITEEVSFLNEKTGSCFPFRCIIISDIYF